MEAKRELALCLGTRFIFIEEREWGLWCRKLNHKPLKIFAPILRGPSTAPIDHSYPSSPPNSSRVSHTALKAASFVVIPIRFCRDATQITTRSDHKKPCPRQESELPGGAGVDEHSADYVSSTHLEESDPYPRQHEEQGNPYWQGNLPDGDELTCDVEHSAERVSCKSVNLVL